MPTSLRRRLRLARRGLGLAVAVTLVVVAVVIGVANQLLPLAERHPDRVAAWLAERAGRPIAFSRLQTEWTRRGPLLKLDGLRIGAPDGGAGTIAIGDAEMLVSLYAGLLPDTPFSELRLRGLDLTLERDDAGRWQVRGLPGQQEAGGDPLEALEGLGELQVIGGRLSVDAPGLGLHAQLPRVDLRLRVDGDRVRAGLRAWAGAGSAPLDASLELDRSSGNGRVHAGSRDADLAAWSRWLHLAGVTAEAGRGPLDAWIGLRDHRVHSLVVDADLRHLRLRGAPLRDARGLVTAPRLAFARARARVRWERIATGWRVDAPALRLVPGDAGAGNVEHVLDGLLVAGGRHTALAAPRLDLGPLLSIAALTDRLSPRVRAWLLEARPRVRLSGVEFAAAGDRARGAAQVESVSFAAVGEAPGLAGLSGTVAGDEDGFVFVPDGSTPLRIDWPRGFGMAHAFRLEGKVAGWRDGAAWHVATPGLRLDGDGLGVAVRGGLAWQGDGTKPRIDIAAEVDEAPLPLAKGFWVRNRMPAGAVRWLDDALVAGTLHDGRALVVGDLDDWPFDGDATTPADGLFRADVRISGGALRFHRDWPELEQVEARASFVGDGLVVDGSGAIAGIEVGSFHAGIEHYREAMLEVTAAGRGDAARLLALLRASPVHRTHGETLDNIAASGPAAVTFALRQPLRGDAGPARMRGSVSLAGVMLRERRWDLAFDGVRGRAEYRSDGFRAEGLRVRFDGRPARLSLRAGGLARDPAHAFEAELDAEFDAADLLERAPRLAWLGPYVEGRSDWDLSLAMPRDGAGRLRLDSNLVGTRLSLPAPIDKPAAAALRTTIELALPLDSGDVHVALGDRMALRARTSDAGTGVRVALGSATIDASPPANGLVATGRTETLAPIEWIGLATGGDGGDGLPLDSIDVTADRMLLFGGAFPETRLRVDPAGGGALHVRVQGATLEGTVRVPASDAATVSGRFARLHWQSADPAGDSQAPGPVTARRAASTGADGDMLDPSRIPPLAFTIDDLRFNEARLGNASLRTRPVPAGLRVEHLRTRSERQRLELNGDWLGAGTAARTHINAGFQSEDFGRLLAGLGYGGRLAGGRGRARLEARWAGSPAQFRLAALDGSLVIDARDGRLIEVDPGAGRVLGLLSLAELPRRLTLDFRDFFSKGFAFNQVEGRVAFSNGTARSDGLSIDGPAAAITITGTADLRAETFNQTIEVRPKAGNVLTVVGAIAGGPVGAALGAAANAVLQKPLGEATARTYRVTGPWKDPEVDVVGRGDGAPSTASSTTPPPAAP
ncbi:MAG TPA: YhdP family protein [Xanthomonadaceae bacterium]|nr:YhdP family protein [Xanthomonadaceae bacterium]